MSGTGIFVFTPYGKGEVLGTRNDGIVIVQLRTSQDKPYLGYFHLTQVRQLSNNEEKGQQGGGGGMMHVDDNDEDCRINNGMRRKRSMDELGEGGVGGGGMALQPQRVRFGGNPFTDMTNHD
jgi:hypothetical protein